MASTLTQYSTLIDVNYPIPGNDNDSQGFRSNFSRIRNSLEVAGEEISRLQTNAVNLSGTNDFNDNIIRQARFEDCSVSVFEDTVIQTGNVVIDYRDGSYQKFQVTSGTHVFQVINWPGEEKAASMILSVTPVSIADTYIDFYDVDVYNMGPGGLPVKTVDLNPEFFELWSDGNDDALFVKHISGGKSFSSPLKLASYTTATLAALTNVENGSIAFLAEGWHTPVWYNSGTWLAMTGTNVTSFWV